MFIQRSIAIFMLLGNTCVGVYVCVYGKLYAEFLNSNPEHGSESYTRPIYNWYVDR